ncbi:hypothetical protein ACFW04_006807 [Cataglyphis niger]
MLLLSRKCMPAWSDISRLTWQYYEG